MRLRLTRLLLAQGAVAAPASLLFLVLDGATRPGYDHMSQPVSLLALGDGGWRQRANLLASGASMLALAEGLRRSDADEGRAAGWGPRLVALYGVGLAGAGAFVTDPNPTYAPDGHNPGVVTAEHAVHWGFSLLAYVALTGAAAGYAREFRDASAPGWARYSAATAAALMGGGALFGSMVAQPPGAARYMGLLQRATIAIGCGWLAAIALRPMRGRRRR